MLIEFSVGNFRSFKDVQTLSFVAAPIKSKYPELDKQNVFEAGEKLKLLKTVGMYGANGSGKSNLVKAFLSFLIIIEFSFKDETIGSKYVWPYILNSSTLNEKTFFQIIFEIYGKKYRYGFEIQKNIIKSEWLFGTASDNEVFFFTRELQEIKTNNTQFAEGFGIKERTKDTNLFLNVAHAFNGQISKMIKDYFRFNILISAGIEDTPFKQQSLNMLENDEGRSKILELMSFADLGIQDVRNVEINTEKLNGENFQTLLELQGDKGRKILASSRTVYDSKGNVSSNVFFDFDQNESEGTKKYFSLSGAIIDALEDCKILFLDEFDARLHPLLTKKIVELFNSPKSNPKNAQLFFVTHDTNLLDPKLLRRDQIYFAEKNSKGESSIYSLTDLNGVRNDASFEKDYIQGKYGAIPFLGGFNKLLGD